MTIDTVISVVVLGALGAVVPWLLMRLLPDSQRGLIVAVGVSIVLLTLLGSALFLWLYADEIGLDGLSALIRLDALIHFYQLGIRAAVIWGPILALTALGLAQGIERRRGERLAARAPD